MAPDVATGVNTPEIWTKLFHYGYNATDNTWANQYFKRDATLTKGHHFISIPDVPAGDYLVRGTFGLSLDSCGPLILVAP